MDEIFYRTAGGVVLDPAGRVLLMERDVVRDGCWVHEVRLPKGHVEPGETDDQAALREVAEETGYRSARILADLGVHEHRFDGPRGRVRRRERYYLMEISPDETPEPSPDPDSEEALYSNTFTGLDDAERRLTFAAERLFIARARAARPC